MLNKTEDLDSLLNKRALTEEEATLKAAIFMEYKELIKMRNILGDKGLES